MKKESLSVMTVKILLAVLLFAGIGTIIIGGGYIVWEYSKNIENSQIMKPVNQETENYYNALEKKCDGDNCCVSSLEYMKENNYKEADDSGRCSEGFDRDMMACITSYHWCVPIKEKKCAKVGEFVNPDNLKGKTDYPDVCCEGLKGVNAYRVNEDGECEVITGTPYLTCIPCENGICDEIGLWFENKCNCPEDCGNETDTSDWQTYQNEEFGFEFKFPKEVIFKEEKGAISMDFWFVEDINVEGIEIKIDTTPIQDQAVDDPKYTGYSEIQNIIVDGKEAKKYWWEYEGESWYEIFTELGTSNKILFHVDCLYVDGDKNCENFIDSFLSTFKFIEKDKLDTSDWQTYQNEEFGFEVKYPEELIIEEFEYVYGKGLSISFTSGSILNYVVGPNFGVAGDKSVVVIDDQNYNMWCQTIEGGESCRILLDKGKEIDFKNLGSSDDFELFKKMLSTFKFIEN